MTSTQPTRPTLRPFVMTAGIVAIVLGAIALFFPGASLLTVAILFGAALVVAGLFRLVFAIRAHALPTGYRLLFGILAALIVIAGIVCLVDPFQSLGVLAFVIGVGWIFEGVIGLVHGFTAPDGRRGLSILAGVVSIVAGVVVLFLPLLALTTFVFVAGILLIVVGITLLLHLPRS